MTMKPSYEEITNEEYEAIRKDIIELQKKHNVLLAAMLDITTTGIIPQIKAFRKIKEGKVVTDFESSELDKAIN